MFLLRRRAGKIPRRTGTAALADGFVFKTVRGLWYVETEDGVLSCSARGKLRTEGLTPLVGDRCV